MVLDSSEFNAAPDQSDECGLDSLISGLPSQYELLGKVSEGGMGYILKVRNRYTGAKSAIKVLHSEAARNQEAMSRFIVEAKAANALIHPNICRVYDFGVTDAGSAYLVMDWIDGIDLDCKVHRDGKVGVFEAIHIFQQAASGLAYAHQHKLVHRDVKPQNIMLNRNAFGRNEVHIVDFGIAKVLTDDENSAQAQGLTRDGMIVGTPLFMSPEQATGARVDKRSDIYSLGCVMYFALTGTAPFMGRSAIETVTKHLTEPPPEMANSLKIPPGLKLIVLKAMEKNPDDRYQSMDQLLTDLRKLMKGVSIQSRPLAKQRASAKRNVFVVLCFVLGFGITYAASIGLQKLLDASDTKSVTNQSASHAHKNQ